MILAIVASALVTARQAKPEPPAWATWTEASEDCDLDSDGTAETLVLAGRQLTIYGKATADAEATDADGTTTNGVVTCTLSHEGDRSICTTNDSWLVANCLVGDIDHDGVLELALLVWAPGSYGPSRPFWVEEDTDELCEHVYLLRYEEGRLKPLWMSSSLELEATGIALDELGRLHLTARDGSQTCWAWQSWGLKLVDDAR